LRIGVPRNFFFEHVEPEVEANVRAAIDFLAKEGAEIVEVTIPWPTSSRRSNSGCACPRRSAYHRAMIRERAELYEPDVRTFLEAGMMIPAVDYIAALRQRTLLQAQWKTMFDGLDALVAPAVPAVAMRRDQASIRWPDGTEETASSVYVRLSAPANVTGTPSVALPCGFGAPGSAHGVAGDGPTLRRGANPEDCALLRARARLACPQAARPRLTQIALVPAPPPDRTTTSHDHHAC
jgi:aspartyl-tRNA(Asn)/glutamyl-tRNA(Gln) amidotransferase subunit A